MLAISICLDGFERIKDALRRDLPDIQSSRRVEAAARGLGFGTNAALRAAAKDGPARALVRADAFVGYLAERGDGCDATPFVSACAAEAMRSVSLLYPDLDQYGFVRRGQAKRDEAGYLAALASAQGSFESPHNPGAFLACIDHLRDPAATARLRRRCHSYGLKHVVEEAAGRYVPNGVLIAAALHLGLEVVPEPGRGNPNAVVVLPPRPRGVSRSAAPGVHASPG